MDSKATLPYSQVEENAFYTAARKPANHWVIN